METDFSLREVVDGENCKEAKYAFVSLPTALMLRAPNSSFAFILQCNYATISHTSTSKWFLSHMYFPLVVSTNSQNLRNNKLNLQFQQFVYPRLIASPRHRATSHASNSQAYKEFLGWRRNQKKNSRQEKGRALANDEHYHHWSMTIFLHLSIRSAIRKITIVT